MSNGSHVTFKGISGHEMDELDDQADDILLQSNRVFLDAMKAAKNKKERQKRMDKQYDKLGLSKSQLPNDDDDYDLDSASEEERFDLIIDGSQALKISQSIHLHKK